MVGGDELITWLESAHTPGAVLAFDGDGTLWSGDVGEDACRMAIEQRLLRAEALPGLQAAARQHALPASEDANELTLAIFEAYLRGAFPECEVCELMTWCYAGWSVARLEAFAREVVERRDLEARRRAELSPILAWARARQLRTIVVSASPQAFVVAAARLSGFAAADVIAAEPRVLDGHVAVGMARPLPYGEGKCERALEVIGEAPWLASFGDNVFDIEMLERARYGVAVHPKPALAERLPGLPRVWLLRAAALHAG